MSRPNRWRCSQLHPRCTRSSPRDPPAARSIEPSVCVASSMNAMTMSTNGTTMMSVTAPVLMDAASDLPKRPSSRLCRAWKNAAKMAAHASGLRNGSKS